MSAYPSLNRCTVIHSKQVCAYLYGGSLGISWGEIINCYVKKAANDKMQTELVIGIVKCNSWEPQKWIAKLRDYKTDDNILIMYCNMVIGHGGAFGLFQRYKEVALEYAFLMDLEGINDYRLISNFLSLLDFY